VSRKTRKRRAKPEPTTDTRPIVDTPVDWARLHARFASMQGRAVTMNIIPIGPVVDAQSPAEMIEKTDAILVEKTKKLEPN
jgi:hypothetical protein